MLPIFTAKEIHSIVGGKLYNGDCEINGVSIDSRNIKKNELFVAIQSKRDGHDFILSAIKKGAIAAILNRIPSDLPSNFTCILVKDSLSAIKAIAHYSRRRYKGKLIAITGSVGKTSTKDILTKMLSAFGSTHSSPKSFNNHLGVPLTLANIPKDTKFVVCEIGMNSKGEIAPLSKLASPDTAIITNISAAHMKSFKNLQEIAQEKASICLGIKKKGLLIFSIDNSFYELIINLVAKQEINYFTFGKNPVADISLDNISFSNNKTFASLFFKNKVFDNISISTLGVHQLLNSLAAFGVIQHYELNSQIALKELKNWYPRNGRGNFLDISFKKKLKKINIRVIDESYNCNPTSLYASFDTVKYANFSVKSNFSRKIAILGDMLELGSNEKKIHRLISKNKNLHYFSTIHCVGNLMKELYRELPREKKGLLVDTPKDLIFHIKNNLKDGDIYLIKGSNSIGLSFIVNKLYDLNGNYI